MVKVLDALSKWVDIASELDISSDKHKLISKQLDKTYQQKQSVIGISVSAYL